MRRVLALALPLCALALTATGTGGGAVSASCAKGDLAVVNDGKLTVGTDNPAYPPWYAGGTPKGSKLEDQRSRTTGKGFETRGRLRRRASSSASRGPKVQVGLRAVRQVVRARARRSFDFDINQISVTPAAGEGRRLQQLVLRRQPGDRRAARERRSRRCGRSPALPRLHARGRSSGRRATSAIVNQIKPTLEAGRLRHERQGRLRLEEQARSTPSSSTCRPRSTSPPCRSRTPRSSASSRRTPGGEHFGDRAPEGQLR